MRADLFISGRFVHVVVPACFFFLLIVKWPPTVMVAFWPSVVSNANSQTIVFFHLAFFFFVLSRIDGVH